MRPHLFTTLLVLALVVTAAAACAGAPAEPPIPTAAPAAQSVPVESASSAPLYRNPDAPTAARVDDLLARMSLAEKIGQITQAEKNSIPPGDVATYFIGSVLSGGGGSPQPNTPAAWLAMINAYQAQALQTPLGIPLFYGVDAVHGHNNLHGATLFPHNIGLGATGDPALVEQVAAATAQEAAATGVNWNFAPVVAVPQDIRWGRTYEGFSENTDLVTKLGVAFLSGTQANGVLATPKHFIGDGATTFGSSATDNYLLDQGDAQIDEATLRRLFLPPYQAAVAAGAQSIMASFSSWNGDKVHGSHFLLTELLKEELGFDGFIVSDWQAIDQLPGDYTSDVVTAINAGIDMVMVPYDYKTFIATLTKAVEQGDVPLARIDDAVRRILQVKFSQGLFDRPAADDSTLKLVGAPAHLALAREAVRRSLVLLKNDNGALPLAAELPLIFVAGTAADDMGMQAGGWTLEWQGQAGADIPGATILDGIQAAAGADTQVEFSRAGRFDASLGVADACVIVVGEQPYAEGRGDRATLDLARADQELVQQLRPRCAHQVVVLISGRPLILGDVLEMADAVVAAWLPGSEGNGVSDVLFGAYPFTGKLPYTWPATNDQMPINGNTAPSPSQGAPLFPFGYGLESVINN